MDSLRQNHENYLSNCQYDRCTSGVTVIIYSSSNLDEALCISRSSNTFGKGMNSTIFPPAMSK